ncbi:hypothetical protein HAP41_0000020655 [Bradyrhizobium barranii subsp. apii]|uniref:Uncharacterized protein n=1 Tax=Bradyrhizobium barranii subsp. apii TaxID=2819348 RepID=A0A8T5VFC7_9BRAD|nr:hypothetical protein [Bradyrhizobium barranii]UPT91121.1 hypothetical protein HAP41_0000020655 [Bradyrhizobium barranii subsp. apii]
MSDRIRSPLCVGLCSGNGWSDRRLKLKFVHGRLPLREVGGGIDHKFRPAIVTRRCACTRHRRLKIYSQSGESFQRLCETRPVADISITPIDEA